MMQFVVCLMILISNAVAMQDMSGKMFVFPQQTSTAHVKLTPSKTSFTTITVCHRSFTDLKREHVLFSLAIPSNANEFAIIYKFATNEMEPHMKRDKASYGGLDYKINTWHSICTTWDPTSGLVQLWFNGQQLTMKYVNQESTPPGTPIIILGQEQDNHGGGFDVSQSFVGMMTDVHMWDYVLSSCEIQKYMSELSFTPGNVLNWAALEFQIRDRVLIENKQLYCQ